MANRYNHWTNTDYIKLPLDAYQAALGSQEQKGQETLFKNKETRDYLEDIEAVTEPAKALKDYHLQNIQDEIKAVHKKNLGTQEALSAIDRIVNNKKRNTDLLQIANDAVQYKKALAENKNYISEYGNDINIHEFQDVLSNQTKLGKNKDAYVPGAFDNYTVNPYIDVPKKIHDYLAEMKDNGEEYTVNSEDGLWYHQHSKTGITTEQLMQQAGLVLSDPGIQKQLNLLHGYYAKSVGGYDAFGKLAYDRQLALTQKQLDALPVLDPNNPVEGAISDEVRKHAQDDIDAKRNAELQSNDLLQFGRQSILETLASQGIAGLAHMVVKNEMPKANEYAKMQIKQGYDQSNIRLRSSLSHANKMSELQYKQQLEDEAKQKEEMRYSPEGIVSYLPNEKQAQVDMENDFPYISLSEDGSSIEMTPLTNSSGRSYGGYPSTNPNDYTNVLSYNNANESISKLIEMGKQYDPEFAQKYANSNPDMSNPEQNADVARVYSKIAEANKSNLESMNIYPMDESSNYDLDKVKQRVATLIGNGSNKVKVFNNKGKPLDASSIETLFEHNGPDALKNASVSFTQKGDYMVTVHDKDNGSQYTIQVNGTPSEVSYMNSVNNILDPKTGFASGIIPIGEEKIPVVSKRTISTDNGKAMYASQLFKSFPVIVDNNIVTDGFNIPLKKYQFNINNTSFEQTPFYQVISKYSTPLVLNSISDALNKMKNDVKAFDIRTGEIITQDYNRPFVKIFAKDDKGNVWPVDVLNANRQELLKETMRAAKHNLHSGLLNKK